MSRTGLSLVTSPLLYLPQKTKKNTFHVCSYTDRRLLHSTSIHSHKGIVPPKTNTLRDVLHPNWSYLCALTFLFFSDFRSMDVNQRFCGPDCCPVTLHVVGACHGGCIVSLGRRHLVSIDENIQQNTASKIEIKQVVTRSWTPLPHDKSNTGQRCYRVVASVWLIVLAIWH